MSRIGNYVVDRLENDPEFARDMEALQDAIGDTSEAEYRKLYRRDDPSTSEEAARSIDPTRLEVIVYNVIKSSGSMGMISDEVRRALSPKNLSYSSVTARYKGLRDNGWIRYTGEKRNGDSGRKQNVMVAV